MRTSVSLNDLLVDELKDLYSAENQIIKALPKLARTAESLELRTAFEEHLEQTRNQVARLERIFENLDASPKGKSCATMEGLLEEGSELMDQLDGAVLDAGLIGAAQKIEHYEIAAYATARTHAEALGMDEAVRLLEETLDEEKQADELLSQIADQVN